MSAVFENVRNIFFTVKEGKLILAAYASRHGEDAPQPVRLWRVERDQVAELEPFSPGIPVGCLAVSSHDVWAVGDATSANVLLFTDFAGCPPMRLTATLGKGASGAAFSADGTRLAVGFSDGHIAVWHADGQSSGWTLGKQWQGHDGCVTQLTFHPLDPTTLVTGSRDGTVKYWNSDEGRQLRPPWVCKEWIWSIAFSGSGTILAVSHRDSDVDILDWKSGSQRVLRGHKMSAHSLVFLKDERTLISAASDCTLKFWDVPTGRERFTVDGGTDIFESMAISPDETVIAAGTRDGMIRLFRRATEEEVKVAGW